MLDESLLDNPDTVARADTSGLLLGAAAAGARVRMAVRYAAEAGIADLKPDGHPRSLIIAAPGLMADGIADLLGALAACPVLPLPPSGLTPDAQMLRWTLPGWAGPLDLLVLATYDGTEPGLTDLVEQAYRRGSTVVAVTPVRAQLAEALQQVHGLAIPYAQQPFAESAAPTATNPPHPADPGALWALFTPLLALTDRIGVLNAPPSVIEAIAARLDAAAERFGPAAETYRNPAKTLAAELDESLPLLWSEGAMSGAAARRFVRALTSLAGHPALAAALPGALDEHRALLSSSLTPASGDLHDFFRDRVEEEPKPLRLRIVLLREQDSGEPATAVQEAADSHETPLSEIEAPVGPPVEALAELLALTDFTTVYLALSLADDT
ncbi:MAG: mannose-6-phosphate isomerase [Streptomycetaceae bacterium]|nr:mannose-6-phosphate isomerase [Streptomycetaceae bacterium]